MTEQQQASFSGWAKVEVMGHQSHIGFVKTEAYGAAVLFRIDTPDIPEREFTLEEPAWAHICEDGRQWCPAGTKVKRKARPGCSVLVGAGSIYRIIPCTEAAALKAIDSGQRAELQLVGLPPDRTLAAGASYEGDGIEREDEDDGDDFDDNGSDDGDDE